ncbi:hypothetical protein [Alkalihalobacillus sp. R86527]|uniref:hypothetical protein n=1 Tax=Alkalihalobacillus sp. R86527 TaxID=3093863 RepID=UPI00366C589C
MKKTLKRVLKLIAKKLGVSRRIQGIPKKDVQLFIDKLDKENIEYIVLRWFETLPEIKDGEDIDILVADKDLYKIQKLLKKGKHNNNKFIKCDIYPESSQKRHMAYYPPILAKRLLKSRKKHESGAWIPNPEQYFFSLSYHVLFHKGFKSGLRSNYLSVQETYPEHDYENYLKVLAEQLNIGDFEMTMESLEEILNEYDWLPPLDIYFRRSKKNNWVYKRALSHVEDGWRWQKGTAVFIIREKGNYPNLINKTMELLNTKGVTNIDMIDLTIDESFYFSKHTRGGDWGRGPAEVSGGLPKLALIARLEKDFNIQNNKEEIPSGTVEYSWVKDIKNEVREEHIRNVKRRDRCNIIHSSDNGVEAAYYIDLLTKITSTRGEDIKKQIKSQ